MSQRKIKLLIVTNSVPLPSTDFLKYKIIGLSQRFDLHLLCWDTQANKNSFIRKYPQTISPKNLHVIPKITGYGSLLPLLWFSFLTFLRNPVKTIGLFRKVAAHNRGLKKIIHQYLLYAPVIEILPDIIHFEYGTLAYSFRDIKEYFSGKVSTSFRGYDLNYIGLDDSEYYTKVWNTFDGYHFLGNDLKNRAIRRGYKLNRHEALIAPGIDTSLFKSAEGRINNTDKLVIVSIGRLVWKKGYEYGIRAVALLKQKGISFEYRIIGDGDYLQALQFTISELGLEKEVRLLGHKDKAEIRKHLSESDVFLHPAISEGFCNAVLEAQAMGIPVVTTDADGLGENVVDGITGFVVPRWDVAAMAEKLELCTRHPEEAKAMGRNGIDRVNSHFRLEDQISKFSDFYQRIYENTGDGLPN